MAKELTQALKDLRAAIERLPELDASEEAEAAAAVEQQRRDDVASAALKQRLAGAESKLAHLQRAHGVLADLALQHPANQPS